MAGIKSFVKQIDPDNRDVTQTQSNVNTVVKQISNSPIIDGVIIKDVSFVGSTDTIVNHKLGREPLGFIVIGQKQGDVVYESTTTNNNRDKFLILKKDTVSTPTITFWVF
tara:strand:- start:502 stop:831 length:330 start_codon:yes stop_codon:yes gene_type:complete